MLSCSFCGCEMAYVHGHAACVRNVCPMFGVNQAECCAGESACLPTSAIARAPRIDAQGSSSPSGPPGNGVP